ncbi:MAG: PKD domain-containing protein, partial [Methanobacteriota archaeon]
LDPSFILSVLTTEEIPENCHDTTAWSDVFYSNAYYDQLYIEQLREIDLVERQAIVHEMQHIAYRDCPYVILYYPSELVAYRTDKFTDFPDITTYPGMTPEWIWFYFEVVALEEPNPNPPYNVFAGADCTALWGETLWFTGYAEDDDDPLSSLNWSWKFSEPDLSVETLYGQTVCYTFENPGTVEVTLTVRDPVGSWVSDELLVDVSLPPPPVTDASFSGAGGNDGWYVSSVDVELIATAVAGVAGTYYSINSGEWEEYAEPFAIITEGVNTLDYYSADSYGTNETHKTAQISIDTIAPESSIMLTGTLGTDGWYTSPVEVTIHASDDSSGVDATSYTLDGGEWITYEAEFTVEADGSHSLLVRSEDVAGNTEEAQLEEFSMDCTNPNLLITSPASGTVTSSGVVTWECSDNIGISSTEISVDSQSWQSVELNGDFSFDYALDVLDGVHEIQIRATDFAGNNATESLSFTLDTTAPSL